MAFFEWTEEYSLGLRSVDEQHKEIIRLMNELYDSLRACREDAVIKDVFIRLLKYANYHFGLEYEMFMKYHYEKEDEHIKEHDYFIDRIKTLMINDFITARNPSIEVLHFLRGWFQNHMMKTDKEYCDYFIEKELMEEIDKFVNGQESYIKFSYD